MGRYLAGVLLLAASVALGQGTSPRSKAEDYPIHLKSGDAGIGVEYMVRSISLDSTTIISDDHLVVEVALYPAPGKPVAVSTQMFTLRVNGSKTPLYPQTPGSVAASLKYPDWQLRPEATVGAGVGDHDVIIGRPYPVERFPGDPRTTRIPRPPRAPEADKPEREAMNPGEFVQKAALPEGDMRHPVSGFLYFGYRKKPKSIRSLELLIRMPSGDSVTARLR